jgi:hypothetical protein
MAAKAKRRKQDKPRFPRKQWQPGQQERVDTPKKGGPYDRRQEKREEGRKVDRQLHD